MDGPRSLETHTHTHSLSDRFPTQALLYAKTMIYRYKKWLKKKEDDDTRAKDVEKVALLRSSEILRGRSFLEEEEEP